MKLQNQVCTLDQAKRLEDFGIEQNALFYWIDRDEQSKLLYAGQVEFLNSLLVFAAYTAAELGEMLPSEITIEREPGIEQHVWACSSHDYSVAFPATTEAQVKADMLLWLLEKGHTTAHEVNQRLAAA